MNKEIKSILLEAGYTTDNESNLKGIELYDMSVNTKVNKDKSISYFYNLEKKECVHFKNKDSVSLDLKDGTYIEYNKNGDTTNYLIESDIDNSLKGKDGSIVKIVIGNDGEYNISLNYEFYINNKDNVRYSTRLEILDIDSLIIRDILNYRNVDIRDEEITIDNTDLTATDYANYLINYIKNHTHNHPDTYGKKCIDALKIIYPALVITFEDYLNQKKENLVKTK